MTKKGIAAAAALLFVFTTTFNTGTAFAKTAGEIPVMGIIAKLLTIRTYIKEDNDIKLSVEIPSVEMIAEDIGGVSESVNQEIRAVCEQYANESVKRALEYRQAFLETGGTEKEWDAHNIEIKVGYELKSQSDQYLSFVVSGSESWTSSDSESRYYTLDLKNARLAKLRDILGDDYARIANESILEQMEIRKAEGVEFWSEGEGGFTGVSEYSRFYVNEKDNPVIVFKKYEIAPGAYGVIEFEIPR